MAAGLATASVLVAHEVAYCLGQTGRAEAVAPLERLLGDEQADAMCRHEAAEGLGALGMEESVGVLRRWRDCEDAPEVVRETCEIALERIGWAGSAEGRADRLGIRYA